MAWYLSIPYIEFLCFITWPPLHPSKSNTTVLRIYLRHLLDQRIHHCDCKVQALVDTELVIHVKMILFDGFNNVYIFLAIEYAYLVACV